MLFTDLSHSEVQNVNCLSSPQKLKTHIKLSPIKSSQVEPVGFYSALSNCLFSYIKVKNT